MRFGGWFTVGCARATADEENQGNRGQFGHHREEHYTGARYSEQGTDRGAAGEPGDAVHAGEQPVGGRAVPALHLPGVIQQPVGIVNFDAQSLREEIPVGATLF